MQIKQDEYEKLYYHLVLARKFDEAVCSIYKSEGLHEKPMSGIGQEGVSVGATCALREEDYLMPSLRTVGAFLAKGVSPYERFKEIYKKEGCSSDGIWMSHHTGYKDKGIMWSSGIVAGSVLVATGAALASRVRGDGKVTMVFFGDGASSRGDIHAAMNFASVQNLPIVFVCENNLWALGTPFRCQSKHKNLADRAIGYGIEGRSIDGQNVLAVYTEAKLAVDRARNGEGPTFLECKTYRFRGHSESHHPDDNRPSEELEKWRAKCPVSIYKTFLLDNNIMTEEQMAEIDERLDREIQKAKSDASALPAAMPELEMLKKSVYA